MKLAILHYHLNRGGVTQVVLSHLRALQSVADRLGLTDVLILHGGRADGWPDTDWPDAFRVRVEAMNGLDYDDRDELHVDELTNSIAAHLQDAGFDSDDTILHIHNHSLGKNVSLPGAVRRLADDGFRVLLHIHDFAEDLRPANYAQYARALRSTDATAVGEYVYPSAEHIHYALLNSRDRDIILGTGTDSERVHCLPNPVTAAAALPPRDEALQRFRDAHGLTDSQRVVLYPVRAIRRKNIGELLLWAAASDDDTVFAITLPATSNAEVPAFERWQQLASRLELRVLFDVGLTEGLSFEDNLAAASRIITTSVAEGFGLVFLEAWLHERRLIGRNIPDITADFADRGVSLDHLGTSVEIPVDWVGAPAIVERTLALHSLVCSGYARSVPAETESIISDRLASGRIDFAALCTEHQSEVIERVTRNRDDAAVLFDLNPWMRDSLAEDDSRSSLIASNAAAVRSDFSLENSAGDLAAVYESLLATPTDQPVTSLPRPENVLGSFLDVSRLCPVRVEP